MLNKKREQNLKNLASPYEWSWYMAAFFVEFHGELVFMKKSTYGGQTITRMERC